MCACVSVCLCGCLYFCVSVSVWICVSVCLCVLACLCTSVSKCLYVSVSVFSKDLSGVLDGKLDLWHQPELRVGVRGGSVSAAKPKASLPQGGPSWPVESGQGLPGRGSACGQARGGHPVSTAPAEGGLGPAEAMAALGSKL